MTRLQPGVAVAVAVLAASVAAGQEHDHAAGSSEKLGNVRFATSCDAAVQPAFDRAMALLHSFEFGPAIEALRGVAQADPSCAMAHWGIALATWGNPFAAGQKPAAALQRGQDAVTQARAAGARTERERDYVAAVAELYRDPEQRDQRSRVLAYRDAMGVLAGRYPDDMEASIFYALALAQAVPPTDKTYADLLKAGALLEPLFAQHPDHPGLAHYIIHTYDVPPLASHALAAARRYAEIAPSAPHALHMPSHTFTRLGYWQESIDTNIRSAATAKREKATSEELHASDYQMYAYLQTGQDNEARRLLESLPEIASRFDSAATGSAAPGIAGEFALAAIPARWALERQRWSEAASLPEPRAGGFAYAEATTWFARGLGAAHLGQRPLGRTAQDALQRIHDRLAAGNEQYWAGQVDVMARTVAAWLALADGRTADALDEMRKAADLEDATEKNALTPGPLAPARELLGEMLLEAGQPKRARAEFAATLKKEPNRFRALAGAARAAARAGDRAGARDLYAELLAVCVRGDKPGRPELVEARRLTREPRSGRATGDGHSADRD